MIFKQISLGFKEQLNMKPGIILTFVAISVIGNACKKQDVIINGEISGKEITKIEYTVPINDIFNGLMVDSVIPDTSGRFRIVVPLEKSGFIILIPCYRTAPFERTQGIIISKPGRTYKVVFDSNKDKDNFQVYGENEVALNKFNELPNPVRQNFGPGFNLYLKDSVASSIQEKICTQREAEIAIFKDMFDKGEITGDFLHLVQIDRYCYYATITAAVVYYKYYVSYLFSGRKLTREEDEMYKYKNEMKGIWEEAFREADSLAEDLSRSPWWISYYKSYIYFKWLTNHDISLEKIQELADKSLLGIYHINNGARKYLPDPLLESYFANYIFSICYLDGSTGNTDMVTLYDQFVTEYPDSRYTEYITPYIDKIMSYQKKVAETEFSRNVKFINDYQNIDNLKQSLSSFKGKKVYIDVWATWCGSCRAEFARNAKLKRSLDSLGIEMLFISVDKDRDESKWQDMIKYYDLEGYHIRANSKLTADLISIQNPKGNGEDYYVPWHILADENGSVVKDPAQIEAIEKGIY
jgi:thiol-disulfide isomerase/thioredoxin